MVKDNHHVGALNVVVKVIVMPLMAGEFWKEMVDSSTGSYHLLVCIGRPFIGIHVRLTCGGAGWRQGMLMFTLESVED